MRVEREKSGREKRERMVHSEYKDAEKEHKVSEKREQRTETDEMMRERETQRLT